MMGNYGPLESPLRTMGLGRLLPQAGNPLEVGAEGLC